MIRWVRSRREVWHGRSRHAQVEASTRWSLFVLPWIMLVAGLSQLPARAADVPAATAAAWSVLGVNTLLCATSCVVIGRALRAYLGERPPPWLAVAILGAQAAVAVGVTTWLVVADREGGNAAEGMALMVSVGTFLMPYALLVPVRTTAWTLAGLIALSTAAFAAVGVEGGDLGAVAAVTALGGLAMGVSTRSSAWYIAVMRELDDARETQSRLAVAEERLRFGRDLHDVLGRNLSVIALKSELAVQLARRGDRGTAALDQMVEVQRIARDSQREVRDVVRGYREADLATELAGARGVLRAAGIDCRIASRDGDGHLPQSVRAALGWVVREGATNVLRHADASRCDIAVRVHAGTAVLTMENDGARAPAGQASGTTAPGAAAGAGGAGLTGLRERLAALHGSLTADRPSSGAFRLTVEIPVGADRLRGRTAFGAEPSVSSTSAGSGSRRPAEARVGGAEQDADGKGRG